MKLALFIALWLGLISVSSKAQDNFGLKFFGLSIHPKGERENAFLMPRRFDSKGYLVLNIGGVLSYEKFIVKDILSVKIASALYADCAAQLGGFEHVGIRAKIFKTEKHSLYGGIGPTLVFRKNWLRLKGYKNLNRFRGDIDDPWQHLFLWYGGEFEYKYTLTRKCDFALSFVPGYPDLMSISFGLHYKPGL
ncbi:hypothetical protein [Siphonobacter sp. SORGH_AS_0500]|uniref:hypothetical protein n=1 Tax=Siphonobacter sp. SORGH_AS_0500 TaxID=1864824 RepID=UPI00285C46E6|nr:hypothetical protein [Siphonobacter sp. SORGH_AS_0500]MDR6195416.1 hypothetical protein [Siphonobacter sp. SORGH_AS_0500]